MKNLISRLIRTYQKTLSPNHGIGLFGFSIGCRFHPTCSDYALEVIQKQGVLLGGFKSLWRILRCGPWSKGGIDYPKL